MNQREVEVLDIICGAENPLTSSDIVDQKKGLTQSTVIAVLRRLMSEKVVEVAGVTHSGKVLSRTYIATDLAKAAVREHYMNLFQQTKNVLTSTEMKEIVKAAYSK